MSKCPAIFALVGLLAVACASSPAVAAVKIADITRLGGQRENKIMGLGLVVGLNATGDGGDFAPAIGSLAKMLSAMSHAADVRSLADAQNVAIVLVQVTIPKTGVHNGDKLDVYVASTGKASSLKGGRLFMTPLELPIGENRPMLALAQGPVELEDAGNARIGIVKGGCIMETDIEQPTISHGGQFQLILEGANATWTNASAIAKMINDSEANGDTLAVATAPNQVVVTIPTNEREHPDSFMSRIQRLPVPIVQAQARVKMNSRTGTLMLTGDVEIDPVVIVHKGLTITTVTPQPRATERAPLVKTRDVIAVDPAGRGGPRLQDLVDALDQWKVPAEDRIQIVKELHKLGALHAELVEE